MPRILVWNINALAPTVKNFVLKHGSIRGFFDAHQADIVCFQETKLIDEKLTKEMACVDGFESFWAFSQNKKGYSGVATYCKYEWAPVAVELDSLGTLDTELNGEGRVVLSDHGSFVLVNVYVPNAGKKGQEVSDRASLKIRFLHALKARCDQLVEEGRQVILVGDFNIAATSKDVNSTLNWSSMYHSEELEIMRALLQDYTDVWRMQHPDATDQFTVWDEKTSARAFNQGLRIDYVLVSSGILPKVGPCEIVDTPPKWSDHAALLADIDGLDPPPPHEPVPESSRRMKKFDSRLQPSIKSMFARKPPARPDVGATTDTSASTAVGSKRDRMEANPSSAAAGKKARNGAVTAERSGAVAAAENGAEQSPVRDAEESEACGSANAGVASGNQAAPLRPAPSKQTADLTKSSGGTTQVCDQSEGGAARTQPGIASFFKKIPKKRS